MTTSTLPNGAGYMDYEDVLPVCTGHDDCDCDEEELLAECDDADFTGASDELGYANDR